MLHRSGLPASVPKHIRRYRRRRWTHRLATLAALVLVVLL